MFPKLVALTLLLIVLAGSILLLRQHRIELAHRGARIHARMEQTRHDLWDAQTRLALLLTPEALERRLDEARLALEPNVPDPVAPRGRWALGHSGNNE